MIPCYVACLSICIATICDRTYIEAVVEVADVANYF
jgi:hypothetical protein